MSTSHRVRLGYYHALLAATALLMLFVARPTMAQDCRAIQRACVASCLGGSGATGDLNVVMRVVHGTDKGLHHSMFNCDLRSNAACGPSL